MNRNTPEDLVNDLIHQGKSLACDEDGFVTLTDKEGNSYVAQTNKEERDRYEKTGKKLSQVKKEKKESEKKPDNVIELPKKKADSEGQKGESNKGAEVVNLKGKKEPEKKFKVSLFGKEQELTKSEVEDAIKKIDKDIDSSLDNVIDLQGDLKNYQKELNEAKALKEFWMYYQNRRDTNKTPKEYLAERKSNFSGISKSDVSDINNSEGDRAEAKISAVDRYIEQVARGMVDIQDTIKQNREYIRGQKEKVQSLKKTIGLAQDSALEKYFDNLF